MTASAMDTYTIFVADEPLAALSLCWRGGAGVATTELEDAFRATAAYTLMRPDQAVAMFWVNGFAFRAVAVVFSAFDPVTPLLKPA